MNKRIVDGKQMGCLMAIIRLAIFLVGVVSMLILSAAVVR